MLQRKVAAGCIRLFCQVSSKSSFTHLKIKRYQKGAWVHQYLIWWMLHQCKQWQVKVSSSDWGLTLIWGLIWLVDFLAYFVNSLSFFHVGKVPTFPISFVLADKQLSYTWCPLLTHCALKWLMGGHIALLLPADRFVRQLLARPSILNCGSM